MNTNSLSNSMIKRLSAERIAALLWISGAALFVILLAATLFGRLGLPSALISFGLLIAIGATIVVLSWFGRTMTSTHYFFADRTVSSAASGFGGGADWVGGTFILVFVSLSSGGKLVLAPALMFGILLTAILIGSAFYRSGASTLPGFFSWRFPKTGAGFVAIPVTSLILLAIAVAEFAVARDVLALLIPAPLESIAWAILCFAIVPLLLGGWLSVFFVNVVLVLGILVCVLIPTVVMELFPGTLQMESGLLGNLADLPFISKLAAPEIAQQDLFALSGTMVVLSAGFAVLPHALSRLALVERPVAAQEHVGWAAVFAFILISTAMLTFGLIMGEDPAKLEALATQPVLHIMPYLALLLLAYNGLSASLMSFSAGIVRGVQRSRNLDPGERSMFGTRLIALLTSGAIGWLLATASINVLPLFIGALALGASSLFVPLVAAIWLSRIPGIVYGLTIMTGAACFIGLLYKSALVGGAITSQAVLSLPIPTMINAALTAMAGAIGVMLIGLIWGRVRPEAVNDNMDKAVRGQL